MGDSGEHELTETLLKITRGAADQGASLERVFQTAYTELRRIAGGLMRAERRDHTLQATAVVNEAYMRLADASKLEWKSRAHFFAIAARAMRQILVEHARRHNAQKRGGSWDRVTLDERLGLAAASEIGVLDLEDALSRLAEVDERAARVVELRFFGGLTSKEVAHILGISRRTVQEDWRVAKMWLSNELSGGGKA